MSSKPLSITLTTCILSLVLAACGEPRPDVSEWRTDWNTLLSVVPDRGSLESPPSGSVCESVLGSLRSGSDSVLPTPDESIDDDVRSWIEVAEGAFFECPPDDPGGFDAVYEELESLRAAVDGALSSDS